MLWIMVDASRSSRCAFSRAANSSALRLNFSANSKSVIPASRPLRAAVS